MSYLRTVHPRHHAGKRPFERRIDDRTASDIGDALRADSVQAAAMAMEHLQVDVQVALRVLTGTREETGPVMRRRDSGPTATG
ncbi:MULTISPECIES: hypothetical protein [unclassified Massilia]|uniref:hypothetical protein n=1 Tax=unclassified Massilia TaxID=2609279 RepID=UPI00064B082F|nr:MULTISPECIES: hypothetical protein [unclassified Massilia]